MQEIGTPSNIITGLPAAAWRNLDSPPYDMANASGSFMLAKGEFPYINGVTHDNMGANETTYPFRFYFLNTLQKDAFPGLFSQWAQAVINDGSASKLLHPILGERDAYVSQWDIELVAQRTAGVLFNVTFVDTVLDPEATQPFAGVPVNVRELAAQADADMEKLEIEYPDGQRTTSLLELINQIESAAFKARTSVQGLVNQALGVIGGLIEAVENLASHVAWALTFNLKQLYQGVSKLAKPAARAPLRKTGLFITPRPMTLDEVSDEVNNSLGELIGLNPPLLLIPILVPETAVVFFSE